MHSFNINACNTSNDGPSLRLLKEASNGGVYCLNLGIGVIAGANRLSVGGGKSNFGGPASFQAATTFNNSILVNTTSNSLNFVSLTERNLATKYSSRSADPQATFLHISKLAGITLDKAKTCNETVNVTGKLTKGEFDVDIGATGTPEFRVLGSSVICCLKL